MGHHPSHFRAGLFSRIVFLQNVFLQTVQSKSQYLLSPSVIEKFQQEGIATSEMDELVGLKFHSAAALVRALETKISLTGKQALKAVEYSLLKPLQLNPEKLNHLDAKALTTPQLDALHQLEGRIFNHPWQLGEALAETSKEWRILGDGLKNKLPNRGIKQKLIFLYRTFQM